MRIVRHVYYLGVGTTASFHHKRRLGKHKTKLTPPLLIEVYIPSQESERSCIEVYIYQARKVSGQVLKCLCH